MLSFAFDSDSLSFDVYVQPRASRLGFAGGHGKALKIMLTAPPADGAANKQCIELLAKTLGLAKSTITIAKGQTSRNKRLRITLPPQQSGRARIDKLVRKLEALYTGA